MRSAGHIPESSEADNDAMAENELSKLQRQYRIMDCDSQAYTVESQDHIRRQRAEISKLQKEQEELKRNLSVSDSDRNNEKDEEKKRELMSLIDERDQLEEKIKAEKEAISDAEKQIRDTDKKIKKQHMDMGGVSAAQEHFVRTQKSIRILENRLDQSQKKFNRLLTQNAQLREEIDHLRGEKVRFESLYKKLQKRRDDLRREIGDTVEQATQAYDSRDEAQAKMLLLKEKADKDRIQHEQEIRDLQRTIDHDKKLKEFMTIKGQERAEDESVTQARKKREAEAAQKKKDQGDTVDNYENSFARIKELTQEEDLDLLVNKFIEVEEKNFALFNYVNEQNNIIENLQEQIKMIKEDMIKFEEKGTEMEDQRLDILSTLETQQKLASRHADDHEGKLTQVDKVLDQLRAGIESLFGKIKCDRSSIDKMLGSGAGVRNENMMQYLGIIEQKTNELLGIRNFIEAGKILEADEEQLPLLEKNRSLLGEGPLAPMQPSYIDPPGTAERDDRDDDEASMSDEELRPLTKEEVKLRIQKRVLRKEKEFAKQGFRYDLSGAKEKMKKEKKKSR